MSILDVDELVASDDIFIKKWIERNCRIHGSYEIINNEVTVYGNVNISWIGVKYIPIQFHEVTGSFYCDGVLLKSLKGCPRIVGKVFSCDSCVNLTSLSYAPFVVGQALYCRWCPKLNPYTVQRSYQIFC